MSPVSFADRERGEKMAERVVRTAVEAGCTPTQCALLAEAHQQAMERRNELCEDDHDARYLHSGRSALVLLLDVGLTPVSAPVLAMMLDSEDDRFEVPAASWGAWSKEVPEALDLYAELRERGDVPLEERLISASTTARVAALCERLDHLRHAHLWPDVDARRAAHREAETLYLGLAEHTHPALARRYRWWVRTFGARHVR